MAHKQNHLRGEKAQSYSNIGSLECNNLVSGHRIGGDKLVSKGVPVYLGDAIGL